MFYIFLLLLFVQTFAISSEPLFQPNNHCVIHVETDEYRQLIIDQLPEIFVVRQIAYMVDGMYRPDDIALLAGIPQDCLISRQQLLNGLFYLRQLGLFETIQLECLQLEQGVFDLKITLSQLVVVDYVKIAGFLRNKQRLKSLYVMDPGDVFDQSKHVHSIEHMKTALRELGYLQAQIHDLVLPENDPKNVVVRCGVMHGNKFRIGHVSTVVECIGNVDDVDLQHLSGHVAEFLSRKLEQKNYTASLIEQVQSRVRALLGQQGFIDIQIQITPTVVLAEHLVHLKIQVTLEKKREFIIWGNSFFKKDQILEHLLLYGKSTWHFPGSIIVDEVEQLYKNKGFWAVSVSVKEERQRIFCFVQEGVRSSLSAVRIINNGYSEAQMMAREIFYPSLRGHFYDKEILKKSVEHFIKSYKAAGFWDVRICKEEFVPAKKPNTYEYLITVDEGRRRLMGTAKIQDHEDVGLLFEQVWSQYKGRGFDVNLLIEQKQWLIAHFKSKGYQRVVVQYELIDPTSLSLDANSGFVKALPDEFGDKTSGFVDVIWSVTLPESIMKFGKTIILGNAKVAYHKLLRECTYHEGDDWDKKQLEATLKNFKEIAVFESVQIYPGKETDEFGHKPVFIKLTDADRYEIKSRFGLQWVGKNLQLKRGFTYKVGGSVLVNQLFSTVDTWSVYADITRFYRDMGMTYDVPWFKEQRVRSQLKAYDVLYEQPVFIGNQDSLYRASQQGLLWNLSRTFGRAMVSNSLGFEFMGLFEADQPCLETIIRYDKGLLGKKTGYVFIEPTVMWRQVDNELNPHCGFISFISWKGMFDFNSKISFCKILAEHTQYIPISNSVVAAIRLRAGHVFNRCFEQIHPIERFYLGGAASIRGYERDYCPPFGVLTRPIKDAHAGLPPCANDIWRYAPQGGRTMFNLNTELRCGVYKSFGVVVFTDCGALFQNSIFQDLRCGQGKPLEQVVKQEQFKRHVFAGSGFGIRYDTPIGPLRVDVGFKWNIQCPDFESRHVLYLSLGQAF